MPTDNTFDRESFTGSVSADSDAHSVSLAAGDTDQAPIQLAQGAAGIGTVSSLAGDATILRASGETVQAEVGTPVFQDDTFVTASGGGVGLSFEDGSTFSLGPDARLTIDSFVYDAGGADSSMVMNLAQGAFSFVSGQVAKSGENNMSIVTPTATIGVRGTAGAGDADEIVLLQEPGQQLGELTVTTQGGTVSLTTPNSYTSTANPTAPPSPPRVWTLNDIQSQFGGALRQLPTSLPANQNLPPPGSDDSGGQSSGGQSGEGEEAAGDEEGDDEEGGEGEEGETAEGEEGEEGEGEGEEGEGEEGEGEEGEGEEGAAEGGEGGEGDVAEGTGDGTGDLGTPQGDGDSDVDAPPTQGPAVSTVVTAPSATEGLLAPSAVKPVKPPVPPPPPPPPPPEEIPEEEVVEGEGGPVNIIEVNSGQSTVTLTDGTDQIQVSGAEVGVTINGTLNGDSIIDVTNSSAQFVSIVDTVSHSFSVNGIEEVQFGNMDGSQLHTITVNGTGTVIFNSSSGPLDANISGDNANNTINIGVGISAESFISANMSGGTDTVNINTTQTVNLLLGSVEFVSSTLGGAQTVVMGNSVSGVTFDLGALGDGDVLTLADGGNSVTVSDIQSVIGGTGNDTVVAGSTSLVSLNLGGGTDSVVATSLPNFNVTALTSVENFLGSSGNDNVGLAASLTSGSIYDGGLGIDTLTLFTDSSNFASITNFESVMGTAGSEFLQLESPIPASFNMLVDLGGGSFDELVLANGGNDLSTANTETITGGSGADILTLDDFSVDEIDLLGGMDEVILGGSTGTYSFFTFANIEALLGANNVQEAVDLSSAGAQDDLFIDLGLHADNDSVTLSSGADTVVVNDLHALSAGDGDDNVFVNSDLQSGDSYDGGAGNDALSLAGNSTNTASILNFETVNGVAGATESLVLENNVTNVFFDFGDFNNLDSLQLADGGNDVIVQEIAIFVGGGGDDHVTLFSNLASVSNYDGGGSGDDDDTLVLLDDTTNTAVINDFEFIQGNSSTGISLTFLAGSQVNTTFTFTGGGFDSLVFNDGGSFAILNGVEQVTGGSGNDTVSVADSTGVNFILGDGADIATGATGVSDSFIYQAISDANVGEGERITNFEDGVDIIDLDAIIQGTFAYIGDGNFSGTGNTEARFVDGTQTLEIDVDGNAVADMEIVLDNITAADLSDADFGQEIAQT